MFSSAVCFPVRFTWPQFTLFRNTWSLWAILLGKWCETKRFVHLCKVNFCLIIFNIKYFNDLRYPSNHYRKKLNVLTIHRVLDKFQRISLAIQGRGKLAVLNAVLCWLQKGVKTRPAGHRWDIVVAATQQSGSRPPGGVSFSLGVSDNTHYRRRYVFVNHTGPYGT